MTEDQVTAIKCAYADLQAVLQAEDQSTLEGIDTHSIRQTLSDLTDAFSFLDDADDIDPGELDGDAVSALASAGWGTTEDYGDPDDRL
jgi:hypothetical protein